MLEESAGHGMRALNKSLGPRLGRRRHSSGRSSNCRASRSLTLAMDHGCGPCVNVVIRALESPARSWILAAFSQPDYLPRCWEAWPNAFVNPCRPVVPAACRPCRASLSQASLLNRVPGPPQAVRAWLAAAAFGPCSRASRRSSSSSKGEACLDRPAPTVAMGADVAWWSAQPGCAVFPKNLRAQTDRSGERVAVLNGGDGLHSPPGQGLLNPVHPGASVSRLRPPRPQALARSGSRIIGDVLHSRVLPPPIAGL